MFLHQFEMMKMDYQRMVDEARELQAQLDEQTQQTIQFDRKLNYARKMLESERKARRETEAEKIQLVRMTNCLKRKHFNVRIFQENKLESLRTLLMNDHTMKDETRKHLQVLSMYTKKRKSNHHHIEEDVCNEINSTGSFLSDLSLTQSGDDILEPKATNQKWKKHRPSLNNSAVLNVSGKKSRISSEQRRSTRREFLVVLK